MKYLKIFAVFSFLFLAGLFTQASLAYAGASLSLSPASETISLENILSLEVILDTGGAKTDEAEVIIVYDEGKLSLSDATLGWVYDDQKTTDTSQPGRIIFKAKSLPGLTFNGTETFAWLIFEPKTTGSARASFELGSAGSRVKFEGKDLLTSVSNGSYQIFAAGLGAAASTPTPTTTTTPTPTTSATATATPTVPDTGFLAPTTLTLGFGALLLLLALSFLVLI